MIATSLVPDGDVLVTFMIDDARHVSVVGDFNDWDPARHPVVEELDGHRYLTVSVQADTPIAFRYLADGGDFYDDPTADRIEPNGNGQTHSVLDASLHVEQSTSATAPHARDEGVIAESAFAHGDRAERTSELVDATAN